MGVLARRAEAKSDSEELTAFRKLVRRPLRIILGPHNLPVAHVNDSIPVLRRFRIVRDHQYRLPHFLVRPPQHAEHDLRVLGIQISGWLVGQHDRRLIDERAC